MQQLKELGVDQLGKLFLHELVADSDDAATVLPSLLVLLKGLSDPKEELVDSQLHLLLHAVLEQLQEFLDQLTVEFLVLGVLLR